MRRENASSLVFFSRDHGRTWSPPREHKVPMEASKIYAGELSTGQRYVLCNLRGGKWRDLLILAVSRPGQKTSSKMWKLRDRPSAELKCGPEWSYPTSMAK